MLMVANPSALSIRALLTSGCGEGTASGAIRLGCVSGRAPCMTGDFQSTWCWRSASCRASPAVHCCLIKLAIVPRVKRSLRDSPRKNPAKNLSLRSHLRMTLNRMQIGINLIIVGVRCVGRGGRSGQHCHGRAGRNQHQVDLSGLQDAHHQGD